MSDGVDSAVVGIGKLSGKLDDGPRSARPGGVYALVAALLHESRRAAPDEVGSFLSSRVAAFGMRELSVYVTDYEQRRLVPIVGSAARASIPLDCSTGGTAFTTASQAVEEVEQGWRLWSVVVDGAARLGVIAVTVAEDDEEARSLADSLAGVTAALLVTRGQCTDAYTVLQRSEAFSLAAEMQWALLPPLSLDSGRVSVAGLIQPAYEVGGDSFDYAVNGDVLHFAVFDAMGHGLESSQLAHLAVSSYRHSRRIGLDLRSTYVAMDAVVASRGSGESFVTCLLGRLELGTGVLTWINVGHPLPLLVRAGKVVGALVCAPTLPAGLGGELAETAREVLLPGDRLFCVTDGVVDSHRPGGEDFGQQRLVEFLNSFAAGGLDTAETVRRLSHTVLDHHGTLSDDTTAFLVHFHPPTMRPVVEQLASTHDATRLVGQLASTYDATRLVGQRSSEVKPGSDVE
ncbi:MAG: PP2C family protein-serine/threonine phosphatase [Mycobacteriales bacterium]